MLAYEKGDWTQIFEYTDKHSIHVEDVANAYVEAVVWANSFEVNE